MAKLPEDILFTIFSNLPIKSLIRFKCISRQWCSIISSDPYFAAMQMNNQNLEDSRILLLLGRVSTCSAKLKEDDSGLVYKVNLDCLEKGDLSENACYQLQGSSNGFLFFTNSLDDEQAVLYNPLTQEVAMFPCQKPRFLRATSYMNYGFGFDSLSRHHKIVRTFLERREGDDSIYWINVAAEVCSLEGSDNSWRKITNFPVQPFRSRMVYVGGAIHWSPTNEFSNNLILVSFLLDKEEFVLSSLPNFSCMDLVEMGGSLGIVDLSSRSKIEIWVKKEARGEWIKEYKIDISAPEFVPKNSFAAVIGIWKNGEVLLRNYPNRYFLYNKESDTLKFIEMPSMEFDIGIIIHRGSLLSLSRFCSKKDSPMI